MKNVNNWLLLLLVFIASCESKQLLKVSVNNLDSTTPALMQAISIQDENIAWISGHSGSFLRTLDAGENWELFKHPTGDTLQYRDIHGLNENSAILMSAGPGPLSRVFTFTYPDQWQENFVMKDSLGFLDCMDFWDESRGIIYGDAIDAYPYILLTMDGGQSWQRADTTNMPKAGKGEGGFAASGTCVTTGNSGLAWIATGAAGNSRILLTEDYGKNWKSIESPIVKGDAAGNTSIDFIDEVGVVTGGDLLISDDYTENCAISMDGGQSWKLTQTPKTTGAFYGASISKIEDQTFVFTCGPNGLDCSRDLGVSWMTLDTLNYWAVSMNGTSGFAVGKNGNILRISLQP